jgi:hypothetical protein
MARETDHSHHVRKVVLPSGKTIEVVYFDELQADPPNAPATQDDHLHDGDLHVCGGCDGKLVYPLEWTEAGSRHWEITLRCPSCEWVGTGIFEQDAVERFDQQLENGTAALIDDLRRVTTSNMQDEIERFSDALDSGYILPEDF